MNVPLPPLVSGRLASAGFFPCLFSPPLCNILASNHLLKYYEKIRLMFDHNFQWSWMSKGGSVTRTAQIIWSEERNLFDQRKFSWSSSALNAYDTA